MDEVSGGYTLPRIEGTCTDNTWAATTTVNAPSKRIQSHSSLDRHRNDRLGRGT